MEHRKLLNWEIEKKVEEILDEIEHRDSTWDDLEKFVLQNDFYSGDSDDIFVLLCNAHYKRDNALEANRIFSPLFKKWKIVDKKFLDDAGKLEYLVGHIFEKIDFIPPEFINFLKDVPVEVIERVTESAIGKLIDYDKRYLLNNFLEYFPYDGDNLKVLINLINSPENIDEDKFNKFIYNAVNAAKDPSKLYKKIEFNSDFFNVISPEMLNEIINLPGIESKYDEFAKIDTFLEKVDAIPELDLGLMIEISNVLLDEDIDSAINYALKAVAKPEFDLMVNLKDIICACIESKRGDPSIAEKLMLTALKKRDYKEIWDIVENSYFNNARLTSQLNTAIKYTSAAVKISGGRPDMIAKHILFLIRRSRSFDGPDGIQESDRFKYKEQNAVFNKQVDNYRSLYYKKTGKEFMI